MIKPVDGVEILGRLRLHSLLVTGVKRQKEVLCSTRVDTVNEV